jgi:hypothetical protein
MEWNLVNENPSVYLWYGDAEKLCFPTCDFWPSGWRAQDDVRRHVSHIDSPLWNIGTVLPAIFHPAFVREP